MSGVGAWRWEELGKTVIESINFKIFEMAEYYNFMNNFSSRVTGMIAKPKLRGIRRRMEEGVKRS